MPIILPQIKEKRTPIIKAQRFSPISITCTVGVRLTFPKAKDPIYVQKRPEMKSKGFFERYRYLVAVSNNLFVSSRNSFVNPGDHPWLYIWTCYGRLRYLYPYKKRLLVGDTQSEKPHQWSTKWTIIPLRKFHPWRVCWDHGLQTIRSETLRPRENCVRHVQKPKVYTVKVEHLKA